MPLRPDAAARLETLKQRGARFDLEVTRQLLAALGTPQKNFPVVLVGGTNGKGSVATLVAAIADQSGLVCGLYTSPHLEEPEECFRIAGRAIDSLTLGNLLAEVVAVGERSLQLELTYFETFTAAALLWFARHSVQLAVVEVGLGGRLDATNACEPVLSLITSIDLDHLEELGPDLASIARHKAGIFRPGRPAVIALTSPEARAALAHEAALLGTPLVEVAQQARWASHESAASECLTLETRIASYELHSSLLGAHQVENLALAVLAAEQLAQLDLLRLDAKCITRGVANLWWPGRLEWVTLPRGHRVLLDGAHNPAGAEALARYLGELGHSYDLLFGAFRDKRVGGMLPVLARCALRVVLTRAPGPRGLPAEQLLPWLAAQQSTFVEEQPAKALELALASGRVLVVCGSLALVGETRRLLRACFGAPAPATGPLWIDGDKMAGP